MSTAKRTRRTPDQLIANLEAKIEAVKRRAERRKAKRDQTLRHVSAAVRSIDKAMSGTHDAATRKALDEAGVCSTPVLSLNSPSVK